MSDRTKSGRTSSQPNPPNILIVHIPSKKSPSYLLEVFVE
ncbi:hypothetical protein VPHD479_0012 [Vibrio phage D479]